VRVPRGEKRRSKDALPLALHGGDDYELLFTVPKQKLREIPRFYRGIPITAIGEITKQRDLLLIDEAGRAMRLPNRGWDPFRQ
jgi:thiamine-monophosphate kinase